MDELKSPIGVSRRLIAGFHAASRRRGKACRTYNFSIIACLIQSGQMVIPMPRRVCAGGFDPSPPTQRRRRIFIFYEGATAKGRKALQDHKAMSKFEATERSARQQA